ncbi:hypothetical protein VT84_27405 [Gemmata sp. SH-PL17]|uniref:TIGR02996 domain-containing protein n=1 Tax=Gemmata sp. SH-PL17 TaxID=1630693 RepID=UPI00078CFD77|nr:TIGR02996 domain-containing protein [Gemmata sp. SH-PL17]AMV28164.1 hypothetical protein VT84_27405 [Gemmata sp. SH-PL17]
MDDEDALLRAICAHPDEDTPRLAFADWLSERGGAVNTAWANGIRAQVWLANGSTDTAGAPQSRVFESAYGLEKLRERLGIECAGADQWERGFPTRLVGNFSAVAGVWARLADRVPCRVLHLSSVSDRAVAEFVTWPALDRLTELDLALWYDPVERGTFGEGALRCVAECPALRGLKSLFMGPLRLTNTGAAAILNSPHLLRLQHLQLRRTYDSPNLTWYTETRLRAGFGADVVV